MRYALMCEPQQGLSYEELLALARTAEEAGFEALFRSDHYASFPGEAGLPTTDAWASLAGLARDTHRIRLGTLVSPVTFRLPGNFAKVVTTVDEMSGGRVEVGLGAGWHDDEHAQLGIPFPSLGERYELLAETLEILHRLWTDPPGWDFSGRHWSVRDGRLHGDVARPGRRHPPIIVGGEGGPRMCELVARWADELNISSATPARTSAAYARLDAACTAVGRDPSTVTRSAMIGTLVGETAAELDERIRAQLAVFGSDRADGRAWLAQRRDRWLIGAPEQAHERVAALAAGGVERLMLQVFLPRDLDMVRLLGRTFLS